MRLFRRNIYAIYDLDATVVQSLQLIRCECSQVKNLMIQTLPWFSRSS